MTRSKTITREERKKEVPLDHLLLEMRDGIVLCLSSPIALLGMESGLEKCQPLAFLLLYLV